jgi:hypothetical protein
MHRVSPVPRKDRMRGNAIVFHFFHLFDAD